MEQRTLRAEIEALLDEHTSEGGYSPRLVDLLVEQIAPREPFPSLRRIADNERAVDIGMICFMHGHEEKLARIEALCELRLTGDDLFEFRRALRGEA